MGNNRTVTKWPGSSQENSEGVFHPLAYKREYSIKNRPVWLETMSGPLLSKCQMVVRVASVRDPVEMALFDFSSLSLTPSLQPFSLSLSCPRFVQF